MNRPFWRFYSALIGLALLAFVAMAAGPMLEARLFPIRGAQSIDAVERADHRVCWTWTFTKLRSVWSDNEDAFLDIDGEPSGVAAPYDRDTTYSLGDKALRGRATVRALHAALLRRPATCRPAERPGADPANGLLPRLAWALAPRGAVSRRRERQSETERSLTRS